MSNKNGRKILARRRKKGRKKISAKSNIFMPILLQSIKKRVDFLKISKNGEGLKFQIDVVEPTGADILIYGKINDTECCVQTGERLNLKSGEIIHILPNEDNLHFFDNQSNERIN